MKRHFALAGFATALAVASPIFAQTAPAAAPAPAAVTAPSSITVVVPEGYTAVSDWSGYTLDQLRGANVHGPAGKNLGSVEDVVLGADGKVTGVVADIGGFLGMGSHRAMISGQHVAVYTNADGKAIVATDMTEDALKSLPAYQKP